MSKITKMENTASLTKTYVTNSNVLDTVGQLLSEGWRKQRAYVFYKERNNYTIIFNGVNSPMWELSVIPKSAEFDLQDWKLLQDMKRLDRLGENKKYAKKLYINDGNRLEVNTLINMMDKNQFNLVFDDDYVIFRTQQDKVKVFKVAAAMELSKQPDGWYAGQKKIL